MSPALTTRQTLLWMSVLDAVAIVGSLLLSCMMPFVGLGVVAALTLPRRLGILTLLVAWAANQALGYGLLGYPTDGATIARGVAMGLCALLAWAVARLGRSADGRLGLGRSVLAFVAAFAAYEIAMYGAALLLGGTDAFTPAIVRLIAINDALWFAGLTMLWLALSAVAPARFGRRAALQLA